jgi:choline monooxygenase
MAHEMTALRADPALAAALEGGATLPAAWYTDPAIYALERERIFGQAWQYVGLVEQVARPGDFFTCVAGEVPLIVTRDMGGELRAFANVCRHRGAVLVHEEAGHRTTFQCHYHAWTYNLDGSLRAAPGMKDEAEFDRCAFGLAPVRIAAWGPFLFVNPSREAEGGEAVAPLARVLGELPALVEATGLELAGLRHRVRRQYEIAANWKVVVDNYLECYHCPVAHKGFCDLIDVSTYAVTEYEYFSTQGGQATEAAKTGDAGLYDISGGVREGFYAYLWPNFTINVYPGPGNVSLNLFLPLGHERTLAIYDYCFSEAVSAEEEQNFVRFIDQVQEEDVVLCESVQRGLRSGYLEQGHLMLSRERALRHFQRLVYGALTEETEKKPQRTQRTQRKA